MLKEQKYFWVVDCETNGLFVEGKPAPRIVEIAWILLDQSGKIALARNYLIKPLDFEISESVQRIHGISKERALRLGVEDRTVLQQLLTDIVAFDRPMLVAHNIDFDRRLLLVEMRRQGLDYCLAGNLPTFCTMERSVALCKLPSKELLNLKNRRTRYGKPLRDRLTPDERRERERRRRWLTKAYANGDYKQPTLQELYYHFFGFHFNFHHTAKADTEACAKCFFELLKMASKEEEAQEQRRLQREAIERNLERDRLIRLRVKQSLSSRIFKAVEVGLVVLYLLATLSVAIAINSKERLGLVGSVLVAFFVVTIVLTPVLSLLLHLEEVSLAKVRARLEREIGPP